MRAVIPTLALAAMPVAAKAQAVVSHQSVYTASLSELAAGNTAAKSAMKLVSIKMLPPASLLTHNARLLNPGNAGAIAAGGEGAVLKPAPDAAGNFSPLSIAPYTTAGAYAQFGGPTPSLAALPVTAFPWRAAGQLTFNIANQPYLCSGSMIKPGILLTAAHCVFEYGTNSNAGWHTNFVFSPGLADVSVLGTWTAVAEYVPYVYYAGTDKCTVVGVVCSNDLALIVMAKNGSGLLPGTRTSWYGYGWNGYSYVTSFGGAFLSHITQLGYPLAFDYGLRMERNDGIGAFYEPAAGVYNTVLGGALSGGSSGGPWLVNFGTRPSIDYTVSLGSASNSNVVVGVTSWGYDSVGTNVQGASYFGQNSAFPSTYTDTHGVYRGGGNIGALVSMACSAHFDHC